MTSEQASQLIQQQQQLLEVYGTMQPLITNMVHDVFPFVAVLASALIGAVLASAAT